jgi:hypothetical protein
MDKADHDVQFDRVALGIEVTNTLDASAMKHFGSRRDKPSPSSSNDWLKAGGI